MAYTTINKSTDYFRIKLYNGNNNAQNITWDETDVNMKPDFLWIKSRTGTTVFDHVAGNVASGSGKYLKPNTTDAEVSDSNVINTFNTNGFSIGGATFVSEGGRGYVAWGWKGAGSTSSNTDGSITSTVSVNTTSGFSVVKVSKPNTNTATIGHGLGTTPKFIIGKDLDTADNWTCYHESLGNGKGIYLNSSNAETSASTFWNSTSPTSSVFSIGSDNTWNSPSILFYCFAEKKGFSKFGSYVGNGSTDGTFVYTGFKPAFVIQKNISYTSNWILYDNKRDVDNVADKILIPNTNSAEASACDVDLLSNGFKFRAVNNASSNWSGNTFIYMAFAEAPLVGTNNVPNTAR